MARSTAKAPATQAKGSVSAAKKFKKKSKAAETVDSLKPAQISENQLEALTTSQVSTDLLEPLDSLQTEDSLAIQKGRQPKHINSTQAIAMGTAAAGISHLFGWL